ncbi:MAG: SUMF1/EgtB/PvdO family nonheme iron enzyme, partial [Planctomycetota bacterium]
MPSGLELGRRSVVDWLSVRRAQDAPADEEAFSPAAEKYVVETPIGRGGMGEVFLVTDQDLRRQVAMKVLRTEQGIGREQKLHFVAEAQATSQLEHPGIPPVHDIGIAPDGRLYFTMKLVQGRTLREVLHDLTLKRREVQREYTLHKLVSVLERVCEPLHFSHERGVVHRDLKPENIMLGDYGEVHVMDWGLARVEGSSEEHDELERVETARSDVGLDTQTGAVKGTLPYMSPEQARGEAETLDRGTDVYALGCLLYEILTLQSAFDPSDRELLAKKHAGDFPDVAARNPRRKVPEPPARICRKAMATDCERRYPTARDLGEALRAWLDGRSERERRHEEAKALGAKGAEAVRGYERLRSEVKAAEDAAGAEARKYKPYQPVSEKRSMIEARKRAEEVEIQLGLAFAEAVKHFEAALIQEADHEPARGALARLWRGRLDDAERRRDPVDTAYALEMIGRFSDRPMEGEGTLALDSDPPGAAVRLFRYVERDGVLVPDEERLLGRTPLEPAALPIGSYLCVVQKEGYRDTRYPVHVARGGRWAGRLKLRTDAEIGDGFVYVPGGPFLYGEGKDMQARELSDFAIARYPVTFGDYAEFLQSLDEKEAKERVPFLRGEGPSMERGDDGKYRPLPIIVEGAARDWCLERYGEGFERRIPVVCVSWHDAQAYCAWKARVTGREWRLPTEEEREKAARGVDGRLFPWGDLQDASLGKCRESREVNPQPEPVGAFPTAESVYGMGDAAGGVWDWTDSWYDETQSMRVLRGGAWYANPTNLRCTYRISYHPTHRLVISGFRCAS